MIAGDGTDPPWAAPWQAPDPWQVPPQHPPAGWVEQPWQPPELVRTRAPAAVGVAAALSLVGAVVPGLLGLFFLVTLLGIILAPPFLLLAVLLVVGSALALHGGRAGVVLLTLVHGLMLVLQVFADGDGYRDGGVPLIPVWSGTVLVLLWLPASSRAWLWDRRRHRRPW